MNKKIILILMSIFALLISGCIQQADKADNSQKILQTPNIEAPNENIIKNIENLEKTGDNKSIGLLIKMFGDSNEQVQQVAMNAVINIGEPAVEQLIQSLQNPDVNIKICSTSVLGRIGDKRAIEPIKQLLNDSNDRLKQEAQISYNELTKINNK